MRILLSGASGFVGRAFLRSLHPEDEVVCIGRNNAQSSVGVFHKTDIGNRLSVMDAAAEIEGSFDALVHMAAYVPKTAEEDNLEKANQVNISGFINILDAFDGRFEKIILGSSAEVYDQSRIDGKINEDSFVNPGSYYGATKLGSEFIARAYGKKNNKVTTVLRFSIMYGPSDPISRALPNFIKSAVRGDEIKITGGQHLRDYIHIDDVANSIYAALKKDYSGTLNIGTGYGVSIKDAAQLIVKEAQSESKIIMQPSMGGFDIVIDPEKAISCIGFEAAIKFPQKLDEMVKSYQ